MQREYNYHTKIMGCDFDMTFVSTSIKKADNYFIQALNIAKSYEKMFSRFNFDSELSVLNRVKTLKVSDTFITVYNTAYNLYKITDKKFNPLIQVSCLGYNKSFEKLAKDNQDSKEYIEKYNINLNSIVVIRNEITLKKSQKLDFGGFLKGYVVQDIIQKVNNSLGTIINIGGDIYLKNVDRNNKKFLIEIVHPDNDINNVVIPVKNKAVCTSGTYKRKWVNSENKIKHHIVDVASKDSAQSNMLSATIIHKNGAIADAYATIAISLGIKRALKFFKNKQVDFVLVKTDNTIYISKNLKQTL